MPTRSDSPAAASSAVAVAAARAFAYRFLSETFAYPEAEGWVWAQAKETGETLARAAADAWPDHPEIRKAAEEAVHALREVSLEAARADHLRAFGYTIRGACPPHEIEYGDTKADALFRPHRLADLASLYRVFGLEMREEIRERLDHLAIECEFASLLAARTAHAAQEGHAEGQESCESAWKLFLGEHLGRWTPSFVSRLGRGGTAPWLQRAAAFLMAVVRVECAALGLQPGSAEIELVSYDEDDDAFCAEKCGLPVGKTDGAP
ncbi:MAG: molecular chaperone TorD family protein [Verrucomicrobiae bacterium]|nr:molecular chaperone TorD family protein [Verrucomicrobiae bacterium]